MLCPCSFKAVLAALRLLVRINAINITKSKICTSVLNFNFIYCIQPTALLLNATDPEKGGTGSSHFSGVFSRRALHVVADSADHGTTYGMRKGRSGRKTAPDPPRRARYASGKVLYSPESGSGAEGDAVIYTGDYC